MHPSDKSEWIEWGGGKCPVDPAARVMVRYRDRQESCRPVRAGRLSWGHIPATVFDIIAYRVSK